MSSACRSGESPVDETTLPRVSLLVPAYNHARFIEATLASALAEGYANLELVVIDDGSTDTTPDLIAAWIEKHGTDIDVTYIRRENRGTAATLNELALRATGEFLRLGASDDLFLPGGVAAQVDYLRTHPEKLAVIGDCTVIDIDGTSRHHSAMCSLYRVNKANYRCSDGIRRQIIGRWAISGPAILLRKDALATTGAWSEGLRIDDWNFFLRLAALNALGFIDVAVGAYRIHGSNTSRTSSVARRVANLHDVLETTRNVAPLFERADRTLLTAQRHLIEAKIAYLRKQPMAVLLGLLRYGLARGSAGIQMRLQPSSGGRS